MSHQYPPNTLGWVFGKLEGQTMTSENQLRITAIDLVHAEYPALFAFVCCEEPSNIQTGADYIEYLCLAGERNGGRYELRFCVDGAERTCWAEMHAWVGDRHQEKRLEPAQAAAIVRQLRAA